MANELFTTDLVASLVIERLQNRLQKGGMVERNFQKEFATAEYGDTINMRRPYYFASTDGAVIGGSDTSDVLDGKVPVVVDKRKKVVFSLSSTEQALDITDYRIQQAIDAAANELANQIELSIAVEASEEVWNYTDATAGITLDDIADAEALMTAQGVSIMADKYGCLTPFAARILSESVAKDFSFPAVSRVTEAMERAKVGTYSSVMCMQDQVLNTHDSGVGTGTILVNGASQDVAYDAVSDTWSQSLILDGATISTAGILKAGDVINVADVYSVNKNTRSSTGELQDFVVKADATSDGSGNVTVTISPPIIAGTGVAAAYNTVDAAPADNAAVTVKTGSSTSRKENLIFCREAFNLAMIPLPQTQSGVKSSTKTIEGLSLRVMEQFDFTNDALKFRIDALWAIKAIQPYYAFRIATAK